MESPFIATSQISWKARRASNLGQLHSPADSKEVSEWHDACNIPVKNACHPATVPDLHWAELGGGNTA
jgi:hypothetical protein